MQFWPGQKAAAVTQILTFPRKRYLHVFLGGGNKDELLEMFHSAWAWGQALGCDAMTTEGRFGWERVLGRAGWHKESVRMSYGNWRRRR